MMGKIKTFFGGIKNDPLLSVFCGSLLADVVFIGVAAIMKEVTSKMIYEYLINFNLLYIPVIIFTGLTIISGYLLVKQRWGILKSKYDNLVKLTKLPLEDKIITIELTVYLEVNKKEVYDFPYLNFILNVHNHSYYLFSPKKVELKCYNNGKKVVEDEWDIVKDKEYISAKRYISVGERLPKYQPSSILLKVPIEKRYDDWYNWDLEGYVIYTNGKEERKVKIDTHHQMSDVNRHKLEKLLEDALGDDIK